MKLQPIDVKMAARLAATLSQEPLGELKSWREAWRLAERLDIRYSNQWRYLLRKNDPVLKVAKELESAGKIEANSASSIRLEKILRHFDPKTRERVERYLDSVDEDGAEKSQQLKIRIASRVLSFQRYLNGENIFDPDPKVARAYFKSLKKLRVAQIYGASVHLSRLFRWGMEERLSRQNPFLKWYPENLSRNCDRCGKTDVFTANESLCDNCHTSIRCSRRLEKLTATFRAPSPYNQHLLDLYVKYTKRGLVLDSHLVGARALMTFLEARPLPVIRSWSMIIGLSKELSEQQTRPIPLGCPVTKIGWMLQELGIIPIRQTEKEHLLENLYSRCDADGARVLRRYAGHLMKMKCATQGRYGNVRTVFEFQHWLSENEPGCGLFTASEKIVIGYLQGRKDRDRSGIRRKALGRFYRWAKHARLTLLNPVENIPVPKVQRSIHVCSGEQIAAIEAFVKNQKSDPEYAFILTLVLYWGLSTRELAMSSIEIQGEQIWINLYRKEMGRWRKSHNRAQVLRLPLEPQWLAALQKRYIALWRMRFDEVRKSLPVQPLVLGRASNRHLDFGTVLELFYRASTEATGQRIPPNVVRRTSGHIHTRHGDASRLTSLGWSRSMAVDFSTLPRRYFSSGKTR